MSDQTFYITKGLLSLLATVLLISHMGRAWNETTGWGQRLRYLTLLYFAVLITTASVEQTREHAVVNFRNVGALVGVVLLIATMFVSLAEYRRKHQP